MFPVGREDKEFCKSPMFKFKTVVPIGDIYDDSSSAFLEVLVLTLVGVNVFSKSSEISR